MLILGCRLENSTLFYQIEPDQWRVIPPKSQRSKLILENHHELAHRAAEHTVKRLRKQFWWPHLNQDVIGWISCCPRCLAVTLQNENVACIVHRKELPILSRWVLDVVGKLPESTDRRKFILVAVEYATRFCVAEAFKAVTVTVTADTVILFLQRLFSMFGRPSELITDCGSCFMSERLTDFVKDQNITFAPTSAYSPQSNGVVERLNKTLLQGISHLAQRQTSSWSSVLWKVVHTYNALCHEILKCSPGSLLKNVRIG